MITEIDVRRHKGFQRKGFKKKEMLIKMLAIGIRQKSFLLV
jgi:hypothetical protein